MTGTNFVIIIEGWSSFVVFIMFVLKMERDDFFGLIFHLGVR